MKSPPRTIRLSDHEKLYRLNSRGVYSLLPPQILTSVGGSSSPDARRHRLLLNGVRRWERPNLLEREFKSPFLPPRIDTFGTRPIIGPSRLRNHFPGVAPALAPPSPPSVPNWCGSGVSGSFDSAMITFTLPPLKVPLLSNNTPAPAGTSGGYTASVWVGLDGWNNPNSDIFQAGVDMNVQVPKTPTYQAWVQWLSGLNPFDTPITNFTMSEGDHIEIKISYSYGEFADGSRVISGGWVTFTNYSTGQTLCPPYLTAPYTNAPNGSTVEWVVETPLINNVYSHLPDFGSISLDGLTTDISSANSYDPGHGNLFNLYYAADGDALTATAQQVTAAGDSVVVVTYSGP